MKRGSTLFLKIVLLLFGVAVLAVCIFWLPDMASKDAAAHPESAYLQYPFLAGAYAMAILFFVGLYQALKLLNFIDKNKLFSEPSVTALKRIKYSAFTVIVIIVLAILFVLAFAKGDDITGVVSVGLMLIFASSVVATCAAVLQRLVQNAIDIKSENDLTV
jgi:hypothetical protein